LIPGCGDVGDELVSDRERARENTRRRHRQINVTAPPLLAVPGRQPDRPTPVQPRSPIRLDPPPRRLAGAHLLPLPAPDSIAFLVS
jgi:hypothetical protein